MSGVHYDVIHNGIEGIVAVDAYITLAQTKGKYKNCTNIFFSESFTIFYLSFVIKEIMNIISALVI